MKKFKKILATVFVLAITASPLYGCDKGNGGNKPTSNTGGQVIENNNVRVTLARKIYLVGEKLDVTSVEMYRDSLGYYVPTQNYLPDEKFSETPGTKNVLITVGSEKVTVQVEVYAKPEDAANAHKVYVEGGDNSAYFDEASVIDVRNKRLKKDTVLGEDVNGDPILRSFVGGETVNGGINRAGGSLDVWTATSDNKTKSVLDSSRWSVPHTRVTDSSGKELVKKYLFGGYPGTDWKTELIFDAEGRVAYMAYCVPNNTWTVASGHLHTTKWYSHSVYSYDKENPALIIVDEEEEVNQLYNDGWDVVQIGEGENANGYAPIYTYEKVIPMGGFYSYMATSDFLRIYKYWTGEDVVIEEAGTYIDGGRVFNQTNARATLDECRGYFSGNKLTFYAPSNQAQQYAYYYLQVLKGAEENPETYAEVLEYRNTVYELLVESANPLVETEPVLHNFYGTKADDALTDWINMINKLA